MITVDLDNPSTFEIVKSWHFLENFGHVWGRVSSGGRGIHLKVLHDNMEKHNRLDVRLMAGDDSNRIRLDQIFNDKPDQILFTERDGGKAGPWLDHMGSVIEQYQMNTGKMA